MSTQNQLQLDSLHCRAICEEIGDRLRFILGREKPAMPRHLQLLMDRLAEQDREFSPSIAPSMDDMVWSPVPATHPIGVEHAA